MAKRLAGRVVQCLPYYYLYKTYSLAICNKCKHSKCSRASFSLGNSNGLCQNQREPFFGFRTWALYVAYSMSLISLGGIGQWDSSATNPRQCAFWCASPVPCPWLALEALTSNGIALPPTSTNENVCLVFRTWALWDACSGLWLARRAFLFPQKSHRRSSQQLST
jgi:hypothetical protein